MIKVKGKYIFDAKSVKEIRSKLIEAHNLHKPTVERRLFISPLRRSDDELFKKVVALPEPLKPLVFDISNSNNSEVIQQSISEADSIIIDVKVNVLNISDYE